MNRLQTELQRLYGPPVPMPGNPATAGADLRGPAPVRAMVLELARPAGWRELSQVWRGVQVDLDLPAPAIAVSGREGYQLWFSLGEPVPVDRAAAFLAALCRRYLGSVPAERIGMSPSPGASAPMSDRDIRRLPPAEVAAERWSAFVAPDLAPVFEDEPWLDRPPGADAQAELLSRHESAQPEAFMRAFAQLGPVETPRSVQAAPAPGPGAGPRASQVVHATPAAQALDPRRFLLDVMNDPAVELHLRIEAAKALLPYVDPGHRG